MSRGMTVFLLAVIVILGCPCAGIAAIQKNGEICRQNHDSGG